jgi:hypothetical protein
MIVPFEQIQEIIKTNPSKARIEEAGKQSRKLRMHVDGMDLDTMIDRCDHFEDEDLHKVRKKYAVSNKDVFSRLLQQEDMIFSARGGSTSYNMTESQEKQMNALLDDTRYGMSLRKWIQNFALPAYRTDPMGIIFIEAEQLVVNASGEMNEPKAYPTYKAVGKIYDYASTGRRIEYVCFKLKAGEARKFGIQDEALKGMKADADTKYFRFVDDRKDLILENDGSSIKLVINITQANPLPNQWGRCPAIMNSDLMHYTDPNVFFSPLYFIVELADTFLFDRSIRDLQKKYHGFAKAIEPLLTCPTCDGTGYLEAAPCPSCTPPNLFADYSVAVSAGRPANAVKGTGYKLKTKVSDVARFPLSLFAENSGFDWQKVFGYVSPDIKSWEKQDSALEDLEELMEMTYWGTIRVRRPKIGNADPNPGVFGATATEVDSNTQPKEARLNRTADWAERTEMMIADFIGKYYFPDNFKKSSIAYGRNYILKTPEEYQDNYLNLRTKGAPDTSLDEALRMYYQAKYQNNPAQLAIFLKKIAVEPFPHLPIANLKGIVLNLVDFNAKLYYGEWSDTVQDIQWLQVPADKLRELLRKYVEAKNIPEPAPDPKNKVPINS